jgi:hypothetical protein
MPAPRRLLLTLVGAATTVLALTSCSGDDEPACIDGVVELGTGREVELDVDCPLVRISGTDSTVDISAADVEEIEINGDRNRVVAGEPEAVRISGQENDVEGSRLGAVAIHGDRNAVSAQGEVGSIAVHGNDNEATAKAFGDIIDDGDRNDFPQTT